MTHHKNLSDEQRLDNYDSLFHYCKGYFNKNNIKLCEVGKLLQFFMMFIDSKILMTVKPVNVFLKE